jgi:hypothetical protein
MHEQGRDDRLADSHCRNCDIRSTQRSSRHSCGEVNNRTTASHVDLKRQLFILVRDRHRNAEAVWVINSMWRVEGPASAFPLHPTSALLRLSCVVTRFAARRALHEGLPSTKFVALSAFVSGISLRAMRNGRASAEGRCSPCLMLNVKVNRTIQVQQRMTYVEMSPQCCSHLNTSWSLRRIPNEFRFTCRTGSQR